MTPSFPWRPGLWPRLVGVALGAWLLASAFLWPHDASEGLDAVMIGLLTLTFAPMAMWAPRLRFGSLALGVWLVFDAIFFRHLVAGTGWNHFLVGAALAAVSLVPSPPRLVVPGEPAAEARART